MSPPFPAGKLGSVRPGPLLALAAASAALDVGAQALRLLDARQGWELSELAPALAWEGGLAFALAASLLALAWRAGARVTVPLAIALPIALALPAHPTELPTSPAVGGPSVGGAPTVVLLTLDTLRRDHVSAYRDALLPGLTPHLERLASTSALFDDAVTAAPLTLPSHTTLLTGQSPDRHGVVRNGRAVPSGLDPVPRRLAGAGYATGAFVSSSVLHGGHGLARWFDAYRDELGPRPGAARLPLARFVPGSTTDARLVKEPGDRTVERALAWLARQGDAPAFLWVHLYDAHTPHGARGATVAAETGDPCRWSGHPSAFRVGHRGLVPPGLAPPPGAGPGARCGDGERARAARLALGYAGEVAFVDELVGRLVEGLGEAGRWEGAALVVVADHGESLAEHNQIGSHEYSLYDPVARVPLIVRDPRSPGRFVPTQVSTARVAATLLRLAGLEPGAAMAGPDLLTDAGPLPAVVVGPSPLGRAPGNHPPKSGAGVQIAVRQPPHKVLVDGGGYIERYQLAVDPQELHPQRSAREAFVARRLQGLQPAFPLPGLSLPPPVRPDAPDPGVDPAALARWAPVDDLARTLLQGWSEGAAVEPAGAELPPEVFEALKALGYVDL